MLDWEAGTLWAALIVYVLSGSFAIGSAVFGKKAERWVVTLIVIGLVLHGVSHGLRWIRIGHGPFITMFEILSSNIWSLLCIYAIAYWRVRAVRPTAAVVMPVLFVLMGWLLTVSPQAGHLPATYHTLWLYVHVGLGKVFLGAALIAVGLSGVILLRDAGWAKFPTLPGSDRIDELAYRFLALGLVFESLMLIAGAIWAQDAWGRYWAWDPLETWAFMTWLSLVFALHLRFTLKTRPRAGAIMATVVFVLAFLTFFGVPFVSTAPYKGAV